MDFDRFLSFLSSYSLPEEKKAFFSYFEKKENEKAFFGKEKQIVFFLIAFLFFYIKDEKIVENTLLICSLFLGIKILKLKENLKIFENLFKARISYEESSWFDLEIWEKPFFHLKYDHLLCKKQKKKNYKTIKIFIFFLS